MLISDKKLYIKNLLEFSAKALHKEYIDAFEISCTYHQGHVIGVREQHTETFEFNIIQQLGITVYFQGKSGYAETSDLSENSILSVIKNAQTIANYTEKDCFSGIIDNQFICIPQEMPSIYKPIEDFCVNKLIDYAKNCEAIALNNSAIYRSEGIDISSSEVLHGFANSHGFLHVYPETRYGVNLGLIVKDKTGMQRDGVYYNSHNFKTLPDMKDIAKLAIERTLSRMNPRKIQSQNLPVLLSPTIARSFWKTLISGIYGQRQYYKNTFLFDKIDCRVVSSHVSLIENPNIPNAIGNRPYDNEAVNFGEMPIVTDGILNRYLLNSYSARQLKLKTTGNAGGISNIIVKSDQIMDYNSLINSLNKGIIIHEIMGQGFNITTGDYSHGAMGYYVEKGEICYPIDNFTIAGNLSDSFQNIVAIGTDVEFYSSIFSGSILINQCAISSE